MEHKSCKNPDCGKEAISFSEYCGIHSNSRMVRKKLREYDAGQIDDLRLSDMLLKDFTLRDKIFSQAKIDSCGFENVIFKDCTFEKADFIHISFDLCRFDNCKFINMEANDVAWMTCFFHSCIFDCCHFRQSSFDDGTLSFCKFKTTEFNGHLFTDIVKLDFSTFDHCRFIQASFGRVHMYETIFVNSDLNKSSLHDCYFLRCHFKDSSNDFKKLGPPILCHFNDTEFINFYLPRSAKRWNNFKLTPKGFYRRLVRMIVDLAEFAFDSLSELTLALRHLDKLDFNPSSQFNQELNVLFSILMREHAARADYEAVGNIIGEYGSIPERYRVRSSFFLPPPQLAKRVATGDGAKLILKVQLGRWELQKISRLFNLLAELERAIPGDNTQVLNRVEQGSVFSEIWGDLRQLIFTGRLLDLEKLELDIEKTHLEIEKDNHDLRKADIELEFLKEDKELDRTAKKQNIEAQSLAIFNQKLDLLERLEKRMGIDPVAYANTPEGKVATKIAAEIREEFPIISLRIEENNEKQQ